MKSLKINIQSLCNSKYLTVHCLHDNLNVKQVIFNTVLLENGQKLQQQLLNQWRNTSTDWAYSRAKLVQLHFTTEKGRLSFRHCREFQNNVQQILQSHIADFNSTVIKTIGNSPKNINEDQDILKGNNSNKEIISLVSDYFIPATNGLEKFYNIQRERKIWWMRYSANPSRYFVQPFDLHSEKNTDEIFSKKCQSITIKSHLTFGDIDMETITLMPLNQISYFKERYGEPQISVVRSVINLDVTTCAMILDGIEHNRQNSLMLNRKLAPYQILLVSHHTKGKIPDIINDFSLHINHVLRRSGLRLYDKPLFIDFNIQLKNELMNADKFGIPYAILVDENSVRTGLMKLRSRDTTLSETIHISDIPNYLLNIFTH